MWCFHLVRWILGRAAQLVGVLLSRRRCAACAALVRARAIFCPTCALTVEWAEGDPPRAAARFGGAVRAAITRLKYEGHAELAAPLAHLALHRLRELDEPRFDAVVPVPLHPARLATRGFNQCSLVAAVIARQLGARHLPRALRRTRATETQASLGRAQRLENVRGAFAARVRFAGERVLLVDDVTTTGATIAAAADALRLAGAGEVVCFSIAEQS
ncbi:MAG: phosphoribosyltransferase family protein [Polyangiaceae bacterium]